MPAAWSHAPEQGQHGRGVQSEFRRCCWPRLAERGLQEKSGRSKTDKNGGFKHTFPPLQANIDDEKNFPCMQNRVALGTPLFFARKALGSSRPSLSSFLAASAWLPGVVSLASCSSLYGFIASRPRPRLSSFLAASSCLPVRVSLASSAWLPVPVPVPVPISLPSSRSLLLSQSLWLPVGVFFSSSLPSSCSLVLSQSLELHSFLSLELHSCIFMASSRRLSAFLYQSLPIPVSRASWRRCQSLLSESSSESSSLEDLPSSGRFSLSQSLCLPGCIFVGVFFSSSLPSSCRVFLPQSLWRPGLGVMASSPRLYGAASESWWVSPRSALCGGRTFIESLSFNVCLFLRPKALGNAAQSPGNVPLLETPSAAPGNVPPR